jgi:hypothetical protein
MSVLKNSVCVLCGKRKKWTADVRGKYYCTECLRGVRKTALNALNEITVASRGAMEIRDEYRDAWDNLINWRQDYGLPLL